MMKSTIYFIAFVLTIQLVRAQSNEDSTINVSSSFSDFSDTINNKKIRTDTMYYFENKENFKIIKEKEKFVLIEYYSEGIKKVKKEVIPDIKVVTVLNLEQSIRPAEEIFQSISILEHGKYIEYYPNGKIKIKGTFKMRKPVKTWVFYDNSGVIIKKEKFHSNGQKKIYYYENGKLKSKEETIATIPVTVW